MVIIINEGYYLEYIPFGIGDYWDRKVDDKFEEFGI